MSRRRVVTRVKRRDGIVLADRIGCRSGSAVQSGRSRHEFFTLMFDRSHGICFEIYEI
jgi:hypothetical protein